MGMREPSEKIMLKASEIFQRLVEEIFANTEGALIK